MQFSGAFESSNKPKYRPIIAGLFKGGMSRAKVYCGSKYFFTLVFDHSKSE